MKVIEIKSLLLPVIVFLCSCNNYTNCGSAWGWYEHVLNEYSDDKEYIFLDSANGFYLHKVIINSDTLIDSNTLRVYENIISLKYYKNHVKRLQTFPVGEYQDMNYRFDFPYLRYGTEYLEYKKVCALHNTR